jgi:hypothetical protein
MNDSSGRQELSALKGCRGIPPLPGREAARAGADEVHQPVGCRPQQLLFVLASFHIPFCSISIIRHFRLNSCLPGGFNYCSIKYQMFECLDLTPSKRA